jgi:uncharacterized delta-60 repeat protein
LSRGFALVAACALACLALSSASAQAKVDTAFGQNGVAIVQPPLIAPWYSQFARQMAAGRDGDSYAIFERQSLCLHAGECFSGSFLFRYLPDGSLDESFGGPTGSYELPREGPTTLALAVDSSGRPLIAQSSDHQVVIRRLTDSGAIDTSFGEDGAVALPCECEWPRLRLIPGPDGTVDVALPSIWSSAGGAGKESYVRGGMVLTLYRLLANGEGDRHFGRGGSTTIKLRGAEEPYGFAVSPGGAIYIGGSVKCCLDFSGFAVRVSAKGRLDTRFSRAARRSLHSVERLGPRKRVVRAIVLRPGGKIDLLGFVGHEEGFELRLKSNGELYRRFGQQGRRELPVPVASAALGSDGATMAVGREANHGEVMLMRILGGGRLDPAFGRGGTRLAGTQGDYGLSVVPLDGRRTLVLDLAEHFCRGWCAGEAKVFGFLEGR